MSDLEKTAAEQLAQLELATTETLAAQPQPEPQLPQKQSNGDNSITNTKATNGQNAILDTAQLPSSSSSRSARASEGKKTGAKSRSSSKSSLQLQTPPPTATPEIKKLPMNKIVVGQTASPNVKEVKSKIGSLQNTSYKPQGGNVKIEQKKLAWKAESKIGSLNNVKHQAGGGNVKIDSRKIQVKAQSKIGSMANVHHKAGGGDKKIFDDKEYLRQQRSPSVGASSSKTPSEIGDSVSIPQSPTRMANN